MLDDGRIYVQKDPFDALGVAAAEWEQTRYDAEVQHPEHDNRRLERVVVAGVGGSALAALLAKSWLQEQTTLQIEVVRSYTLPQYVDKHTLVICSSYSGNTEETLAAYTEAREKGAQVAILAAGGQLVDEAQAHTIASVMLPDGTQPRMAMLYNLRGLVRLLVHFGLVEQRYYDEIAASSEWLRDESTNWLSGVTTDKNIAKQLALVAVGKTPVFYTGHLMAPVAYKWKISWNENAKNVAFWNELPEFNHNEFMGWASHPVEKPFAVFDLVSSFEHARIQKRFQASDRLLSGRRPKSHIVHLQGETPLAQMLWGCILADFVSIYVAVLNGVDPTPVQLIEKLKQQLAQ